LVPVEFESPDSDAAVELAGAIARSCGAGVTLFHALEPPGSLSGLVPGADDESDLVLDRKLAADALEKLAVELRAQGTGSVATLVEPGYPIGAIVRRAHEDRSDLIVMGTHGRTGLARMVLGSVSQGVMKKAPCRLVVAHVPKRT
jgi:nucleotide-binding universal stress UspA family protein